jgi:hypothetical protein
MLYNFFLVIPVFILSVGYLLFIVFSFILFSFCGLFLVCAIGFLVWLPVGLIKPFGFLKI